MEKKENVIITIKGKTYHYPKGTSLYTISKDFQKNYQNPIIVAERDGAVCELQKEIHDDSTVDFYTIEQEAGHRTYIRGITVMLIKALFKEFTREKLESVKVEYTIDTGIYCDLKGNVQIDDEILSRVKERMEKYVEKDFRFIKESMNTLEAMKLFEHVNMPDKVKLISYRRSSRVNVYRLGNFVDYCYGPMPYSTKILKQFELKKYMDGIVFIIPEKREPNKIPSFTPSKKLFYTMQQANHWGEMMKVDTVGALNDTITNGNIRQLMLVQEALHEKKIGDIAEEIAWRGDKKIVTIAGPSSSGKTTFSYRLSVQLETLGVKPHPIGVDDYFVNREDTPLDENGKFNYECLEAIDVKQLNEDLTKLLNGEEVQLPTYNFITGKREYKKPKMKLGKDDVLVIEGIHGLNDKLTYSIPAEKKYKIYISALTQLNIDEHNRIPTTDGRLIRRIIRDARTRGNSARRTIAMWDSVRRGENKNIFPFQEGADAMFNSTLVFELSMLKQYAEPLLFSVPRDCPEYGEAKRLLKFLDYFLGIGCEELPRNSLLREFVGGSILVD